MNGSNAELDGRLFTICPIARNWLNEVPIRLYLLLFLCAGLIQESTVSLLFALPNRLCIYALHGETPGLFFAKDRPASSTSQPRD